MDLHRLGEERSLAFHQAIAARLLADPRILDAARARVRLWLAETPDRPFAKEWAKILSCDLTSVAELIVDRGERAAELRQSSPFAGVLDPRERWRIWRETRQALEDNA